MKLENKTAGELLGKNRQKSQNAAKNIINIPDIDEGNIKYCKFVSPQIAIFFKYIPFI